MIRRTTYEKQKKKNKSFMMRPHQQRIFHDERKKISEEQGKESFMMRGKKYQKNKVKNLS